MVSFRTLTTLALAAVAVAQSTPAQVITNLNNLKLKSQGLHNTAFTINIINGPLVIIGQGPLPIIISGLQDIVTTTNTYLQTGVATVAAGTNAESILKSYRDFVSMHQAFCTVLASRAYLLQAAPLIGQPMAAILSEDRNVLKSYATQLANAVKSKASDILISSQSLDKSIADAVTAYEGLQLKRRAVGGSLLARAVIAV